MYECLDLIPYNRRQWWRFMGVKSPDQFPSNTEVGTSMLVHSEISCLCSAGETVQLYYCIAAIVISGPRVMWTADKSSLHTR